MANAPVVIVMGVAGSGKSTVARLLAERLSLPFLEADDFHTPAAMRQMSEGHALAETQRSRWLARVNDELVWLAPDGVVCACSALTQSARDQLSSGIVGVRFVWVHGPPDLLHSRLAERVGHPVGTSLLPSQLQSLEPPTRALRLDARHTPAELVDETLTWLDRDTDSSTGP